MSADDRTYDEACAEVYDEWFGACEEAAVDCLAELAGGGRVLELGIGSGLLALPLAARGIDVHGIDLSPAMVARLRAKPGGEAIPVTMGSFADVAVEGEFSLIFVAYNTFFALQTQDEQVRCFQNVAAHLAEGGTFVLEAFVPPERQLHRRAEGHRRDGRSDRPESVRARSRAPAVEEPARGDPQSGDPALPGRSPLRLAGRARPDGAARRAPTPAPVEQLEPGRDWA